MEISLYDTIQSHIKDFENQLYTSCPAIVHAYDPTTCSVDVFPTIYRAERDGKIIKEQILQKVPLHFQATRELGITFPVKKGDTVLLVFSYCDTENWLSIQDTYVKPRTYRKHNLNDAFAIAGVFKYSASPVQQNTENDLNIRYGRNYIRIKEVGDIVVLNENGQSITIDNTDTVTINSSANVVINASNFTVNGDLHINGAVNSTGDVVASGISLVNHTHTGDSGGTTSPPL